MTFDFPALLVLLTFISGSIWFYDKFAKKIPIDQPSFFFKTIEFFRSLFIVFLIVLIIRSFIIEPYRIPSSSMMPTLLIGDFILVNKYHYGIRLPVIHSKIIANKSPQRGDIIVFRYPENPKLAYIKRVIGVPGDKIIYQYKKLYINDQLVSQTSQGLYEAIGSGIMMDNDFLITEYLDDTEYQILNNPLRASEQISYVVPKDHYFVLGDNRDNSKDSRYWGFVPEENLMGRAFMIWMNWDWKAGGINFSRIGTILD